jgi:hypothetical protein
MKMLIKGQFRKILNQYLKSRDDILFVINSKKIPIKILKVTPYKLELESPYYTHLLVFDIQLTLDKKEVFGDDYFIRYIKSFPNSFFGRLKDSLKWFYPPSNTMVQIKFNKITIIRK